MMTLELSSAIAKTKRANSQIMEINTSIIDFCSSRYSISSVLNADATQESWRVSIEPIPEDLPVIVGEVLHNLRSALDILAVGLAVKHTGSGKKTYFPFGKTKHIFELAIKKNAKKLPDEAVNLIRELKPYAEGNKLLWLLHDLNREDKHNKMAALLLNSGMMASELIVLDSEFSIIGDRRGQHMASEKGHEMLKRGPDPDIGVNDYEFLTLSPGGKFKMDMEPKFNLSFEIDGKKDLPVAKTLSDIQKLVSNIIQEFEKRFF